MATTARPSMDELGDHEEEGDILDQEAEGDQAGEGDEGDAEEVDDLPTPTPALTSAFVINGFYMSMREKYTKADAKIHYFVVKWDGNALSWKDFRGKVLGATDPETAEEGSVRREILNRWQEFGLASKPNVGDNGVHASASPFESLAERMNWLNVSLDEDAFGKQLLASVDRETILGWTKDPQVEFEGKKVSCFDSLEDTNSAECLNICQRIAGVEETKATDNTNTAFVFVKPHAAGSEKAIAAVKAGLGHHNISVLAEGDIDGPTIESKQYIDNHYYAIANKAALSKPRELNPPAKAQEEFQAKFGVSWLAAVSQNRVFNAVDGCKVLEIDGEEMDKLWAVAKQNNELVKFGGGFYAGRVEKPKKLDPEFDLILDPSLAKNEWPAKLDEIRADPEHVSLMAQTVTREVFERLKDKKSAVAGWTLARAINTGVMYPSSFVGIHAADLDCYVGTFREVFEPIVEGYHKGFKMSEHKHITDLNPSKISATLSASAQKKIISTRIRVARNLASFPLNPGGTLQTRLDIADLMSKVFAELKGDFRGEFFRHSSMTDEQRKGLIADHFLFRGADAMQAASGYHEYWPLGRGIFHNKGKTFLLWINEGDHLRIISMENGGDVVGVAQRLHDGIKAIEQGLQKVLGTQDVFMADPVLGCITCCPSNLGTGMRGSVHILVPKLIAKMGLEGIDKICRERNCQARGSSGEHSKVVDRIDVSNWRRLGFAEYELVSDMITAANYLAQLEDELPDPILELPWEELMEGGVRKKTTKLGTGVHSEFGQQITIEWEGRLQGSGAVFQESRRDTIVIGDGEVIPGLELAARMLARGEVADVQIEPRFGYGDQGLTDKVPPNSALELKVEVVALGPRKQAAGLMSVRERCEAALRKKDFGKENFSAHNWTKAVTMYKKALEYAEVERPADSSDPENAAQLRRIRLDCLNNVILCLLKLERLAEAKDFCVRVLEIDSGNVKALTRAAQICVQENEFEEATQVLDRALTLEPNNATLKQEYKKLQAKMKAYRDKERAMYGGKLDPEEVKKATAPKGAAPAGTSNSTPSNNNPSAPSSASKSSQSQPSQSSQTPGLNRQKSAKPVPPPVPPKKQESSPVYSWIAGATLIGAAAVVVAMLFKHSKA